MVIRHSPRRKDLPKPVYSCAHDRCAETETRPAEMLYWFHGWEDLWPPGFYCENCWDHEFICLATDDGYEVEEFGESLEEVLDRFDEERSEMADRLRHDAEALGG